MNSRSNLQIISFERLRFADSMEKNFLTRIPGGVVSRSSRDGLRFWGWIRGSKRNSTAGRVRKEVFGEV